MGQSSNKTEYTVRNGKGGAYTPCRNPRRYGEGDESEVSVNGRR